MPAQKTKYELLSTRLTAPALGENFTSQEESGRPHQHSHNLISRPTTALPKVRVKPCSVGGFGFWNINTWGGGALIEGIIVKELFYVGAERVRDQEVNG